MKEEVLREKETEREMFPWKRYLLTKIHVFVGYNGAQDMLLQNLSPCYVEYLKQKECEKRAEARRSL